MNGRLYDPKLHRFLQPDNYVQDPSNTQNFNRYGYCWNNPLKYTDASGEWINIVIGAVIGGVVNWAMHGCQFNAQGALAFGIGAAGGALIGMGNTAGLSFFAAGAQTAALAVAGTMVTNVGNHIAFGDPLMTPKELAITAGVSFVTGGLFRAPRVPVSTVSELTPAGMVGIQAESSIVATAGPTTIANTATGTAVNASTELAKGGIKFSVTTNLEGLKSVSVSGINPIALDEVVVQGAGKVANSSFSGAYLLRFASGKFYAGKGLEPRMLQSIARLETKYQTTLISKEFFEATSTNQAFKIEFQIMMENGGPKSFNQLSETYNLIHSPGAKLSGF